MFTIFSLKKQETSRLIVAMLTVFCVALFAATPAKAANADLEPLEVVKKGVDDILGLLKNPEYKNDKEKQAKALFDRLQNFLDMEEMSRRSIGKTWRKMDDTQRNDFIAAFSELLGATYIESIQSFSDEKVIYTGERKGKRGRVEVQSKIVRSDGVEIPVNYRMSNKSGEWKIYDVVAEGISVVSNYNSQFKSLLLKETPEQLIERIKDRTRKLREKQNAK